MDTHIFTLFMYIFLYKYIFYIFYKFLFFFFFSEHSQVQQRQAANHMVGRENTGMTVSRNGCQPVTMQYENMGNDKMSKVMTWDFLL